LDAETQIRELEASLHSAEVRRSTDRLRELLAEEFVEFGASGAVLTRRDILESVSSEEPRTILMEDPDVRLLPPNCALITYRALITTRAGVRQSLRSSLWRREGSRWRMIFHQGTPQER